MIYYLYNILYIYIYNFYISLFNFSKFEYCIIKLICNINVFSLFRVNTLNIV